MATLPDFRIEAFAPGPDREAFRDDVLAGLARPRRSIPGRWLYGPRGRELFDEVVRQPEYYLARAEAEILADRCAQMGLAIGGGRMLVELGDGDPHRAGAMLDSLEPAARVRVGLDDVAAAGLPDGPRLGFLPGSAIGAFAPARAVDLLRDVRSLLGADGMLMIGMDLIKERTILTAAHDDAAGANAAFALALAERINDELDGNLPVEALRHRVIWNAELARIERHLEAARDLAFSVAGRRFAMRAGDTVHVESCHKYELRSATTLMLAGGWETVARYCDRRHRFMVILARQGDAGIVA